MLVAPFPDDEAKRLASLRNLNVLDTNSEAEFDGLVKVASLVCGTPIALISLVDHQRQWFKANVGLQGVSETPREVAFCSHAILGDDLFEVPDATADSRFADNRLVEQEPHIRFYAGSPIKLSDGSRVGTLCVIDRKVRRLSPEQHEILGHLACAAASLLEGKRAARRWIEAAGEASENARKLAYSEARLRQLYEQTPALLHSMDRQGRLLAVSDVWLARLGYEREEVIGRSFDDFLTLSSREAALLSTLPSFIKDGICEDIPYQLLTKEGQVVEVLLSSVLEFDQAGTPVRSLAAMEDITLRKRAELALHEEHRRLTHILEGTHAGTWEWDVESGAARFNERWANMIGYTLAELEPVSIQTWFTRVHPDDLAHSQQIVEKHFIGVVERCECEMRLKHRDGHWIWVQVCGRVTTWTSDGKPEWIFGTQLEISERKLNEVALQEASDRMRLATDSGGIGIFELDVAAGTLHWDAWMYRLYGMQQSHGMLAYAAWLARIHPEDRSSVERAIQSAVAERNSFDLQFRAIWDDGALHHLRCSAHVGRNARGLAIRIVGATWDITESQRLSADLAAQHEMLRVTLQSIGDAVITADSQGNIVWLNPVAERMTGWLSDEAAGRPLLQVFHIVNEETRQAAQNPIAICLAQGKSVGLANHTLLISRNGEEFGIEDSAAPIRNERGEVLGVVLVFHDVTEQRRLSAEMSYRATHDTLTGLVNRVEFETRLQRALDHAHESLSEHALLYIDLDQFKLVNDACGHAVGDQLLQQVSKLLSDTVRTRDTLARLGGDEFGVILEHCTAEQAQRVAQQICDRMEDFRFIHDARRFRMGASIGLVPVDSRWRSTSMLLQAADTSCYAAKEAGRNRVHAWFDSDLVMRARHGETQWATRIEQALDEDRFVLFAQRIEPLRDMQQGIHAEALLRMVEPDGAVVLPGAFLPAAERFHLAPRIDRWVLKAAIAWLKAIPKSDAIDAVSVNLSGQSIGDRAFHRWALDILLDAGSGICRKLCLEITETVAVTNFADAALFIEQVRAVGVRVALDDFGAGASSFGYLKNLPVDFLKIDGQFITDLIEDPLDEAAVNCFAQVAKAVGVRTVAEFVDKPAVLERLRSIGIDFAQGFLMHRPAPINELLLPAHVH